MRSPLSTRPAALAGWTALAVTAAAGTAFVVTGPAAAAPRVASHAGATSKPTVTPLGAAATSEPTVTLLAAALVSGRIDVDRHAPSDVVTARITFARGSTTGWHAHPGAVFVQVTAGSLTLRHAKHGRCIAEVITTGHGFFEVPGAVHLATNTHRRTAVAFATFVLPHGAPPQVPTSVPAACR